MKKIIVCFIVVALAAFNSSCSHDDGADAKLSQLALSADVLDILVGESVGFTVSVDDKIMTDAALYLDSQIIPNPHVFDAEGTYTVVAKKQGYTDSKPLTIKVHTSVANLQPLALAASKTTVVVGESVQFNITTAGEALMDAELYIGSERISNPHTFDTAGTFEVQAKKTDFTDSNTVSIQVTTPETPNKIVGKWIPQNIVVTAALTGELYNENYPHQVSCDADYFTFRQNQTVEMGTHTTDCTLSKSGANWSLEGNTLRFNVMDYDVSATVVSNTDTQLVIDANGSQFAPLVPVLFPDIDPTLLALLPMTTITLTFEK